MLFPKIALLFLSIFGLMHLYFYKRIAIKNWPFRGLLVFLFLSPILMRLADKYLSPQITFFIGFTALLWMGFLLYFVVIDLFLRWKIRSPFYSLLLTTILSIYSYQETLKPEIYHITIFTSKLPKDYQIRILHITDVHLGPVMGFDKINLIRRAVERFHPDIIISTGDLVDGNMRNRAYLAHALAELKPLLGKYAVVGNHEYYRGIERAIEFTEASGFEVLRGSFREIDGKIVIAGLDDDDCRFFKACVGPLRASELLEAIHQERFIILLKHKPTVERTESLKFDLMLSGHTHGGLYYPIGKWLLKLLFGFEYPGLQVINGSHYIFVSKGLGTGGPPMRFLSPPDMAIIDLKGGAESFHQSRLSL